ncbi:helix-turn-helix domain-containing protein [Lacinutrix jangbogonensis]|uniref:helix-turn-helix domain-containing protein n=1 Tax=Lacinutrix jangbogonensis TaxID=1469557 RepID=UPI00053E7BF5|nr:helix-turn-helix transcriptional regulator [Lacinutrix jangbogonensis]
MINNEEFTKRLKKVIDYYGESASSFAEKIDVQRSSISHILSGRNKPSLEFVLKVLSSFPEVELYWLMNGKGNFPSEKIQDQNTEEKPKPGNQNLFPETKTKKIITEISETKSNTSNSKKEIDRIIIFYKDGSFSNFEN